MLLSLPGAPSVFSVVNRQYNTEKPKLQGDSRPFQPFPAEWLSIHHRLFEGVFSHAGQVRQYNITKKEWVLNGDTVIYADWNSIKDTLDYDFAAEKQFSYEGLSVEAAVKHLAKFSSDIWQIHPFGEGNTRATAVFMIKYMKAFGFRVNNDAFEKNSWYFRNALVRANYTNLQKGVHATTKFLEMFFGNLLLGTEHELKNRYMHIDYVEESHPQSINFKVPKYQFDTLACSLEELAVLELVAQNPAIKQQELVTATGKSIATVKRIMKSLQDNKIKTISAEKAARDMEDGKCWFDMSHRLRQLDILSTPCGNRQTSPRIICYGRVPFAGLCRSFISVYVPGAGLPDIRASVSPIPHGLRICPGRAHNPTGKLA